MSTIRRNELYRWETDDTLMTYLDKDILTIVKQVFVRIKGFHEGIFRGFYYDDLSLEYAYDD